MKSSTIFLVLCAVILAAGGARTFNLPADVSSLDDIEKMIDDGWWDDAGRQLDRIIEKDGNSARAHYLLAEIYLQELDMGRHMHWDEAEDHAKKAVELDGDDVDNLMILGHVMGIKARDGSKLKAMGRAKTSLGSYERAVALEPDNIQARAWLINYHINAPGFAGGDREEARRQAEAIAKISTVEGHYSMADIHEFIDKDLAAAETELKAAMAADPGSSKPYYIYGDFLSRNGRYDDALSQYEKLAAVDSSRQEALMKIGFLYQKQEKWNEALENFELCLSEHPDYYKALYQVGKTNLIGEIDLAKAETAFNEYIAVRTKGSWPSKADAYWRLAMVYEAQGKSREAKAACREAKNIDPGHREAKKLCRKLKRR